MPSWDSHVALPARRRLPSTDRARHLYVDLQRPDHCGYAVQFNCIFGAEQIVCVDYDRCWRSFGDEVEQCVHYYVFRTTDGPQPLMTGAGSGGAARP